MSVRTGHIAGINGNMLVVDFADFVVQNEVAYALTGKERLKSEVIRVRGKKAELQVYENTEGLKVGDPVEFTGELLAVKLGPGLLTQIFDGLQNPLPEIAEKCGFFLKRGFYIEPLSDKKDWEFTPIAEVNQKVRAGDYLGKVPEGIFDHYIMVPFEMRGEYEVISVAAKGSYKITDNIAELKDSRGQKYNINMIQVWPVKIPIAAYREKLKPEEPLVTKVRIIDTMVPIARGGTYCIPGPFGAGKTVLQQITSRNAEVDIVIIAACGERAGEVVETLKEFPKLIDPRTEKPLIERTIIICNTSSMPVAARESSVYTAVTLAEYYRQMGLNVLLLADSTSRWAQAMREMSGRLEEIPGEEAFPAYLESRIASFYERAGIVRLNNGELGSVTIGGAVSPAGGNFEEPVTQATLKVVGAFLGLSRERSDARRYPSIDVLDSWSKYKSFVDPEQIAYARGLLVKSAEVDQMMKVVGEEGTSLADFIDYLKGEYIDEVYLQQNAYDKVDDATSEDRQKYVFNVLHEILTARLKLRDKDAARSFFHEIRQIFRNWNSAPWESDEFKKLEKSLRKRVAEISDLPITGSGRKDAGESGQEVRNEKDTEEAEDNGDAKENGRDTKDKKTVNKKETKDTARSGPV
ncbi:MAG: V-type ATP synthase subunit A [Candidatus Euphemobacter frigidus]|nr:V-type ATP synthase subunit A [Candidatus Euphemobacter frigidus]MDP8276249.1 V-type ATP synthase subunit A [Candidatus Euphemobacter frigidus]